MTDPLRITLLVDNRGTDVATEHGLSMWIEAFDQRILFDTGQGSALMPNVRQLGIDLSGASAVVLSHGHYDHTGGLSAALGMAREATIHAHPDVLLPRYSIRPGAIRQIGIPAGARAAFDSLPPTRLRWVEQPTHLAPGIGITGPIPRTTSYEDTGGPFFLDAAGQLPDPITDDLSLWLETPQGLVVCTGCCHAGLVNTLNHICAVSGDSRIRAIIGGLHLLNADETRLATTIEALRTFNPGLIVP